MKFKTTLFWATELQPGFKCIETINLPIISQKIGYLHLEIHFLIFKHRVAWAIS